MISVMLRRIGIDLIDNSLWWSDMIDFSCLSFRQVLFIYLPHHPRPPQSLIFFFSHLLREFLETAGFQNQMSAVYAAGREYRT